MFTPERHQAILDLLEKKQRLTVRELERKFKVSAATLRRDLTDLERADRLVRVHGGAVHPQCFKGERTFDQKSKEAEDAKRAMGLAAAALVETGQVVFIDAGTSCFQVGRALATRGDVTLVTNSPAFVHSARDAPAKIICVGGELRAVSGALVGGLALDWVQHLHADWAFVGASGLSIEEGASTTELGEAAIKQAMMSRSQHRVLVADARKWETTASTQFALWEQFEIWVTDDALPIPIARRLSDRGLRVIRAGS